MNREQLKYMKERIATAKNALRPWSNGQHKAPAAVVRARAVCKAWQDKCEAIDDARRAKVLTLVRDAEEAMYLLSDEEAIKKVKALEAMVGKI